MQRGKKLNKMVNELNDVILINEPLLWVSLVTGILTFEFFEQSLLYDRRCVWKQSYAIDKSLNLYVINSKYKVIFSTTYKSRFRIGLQ